MLIKAGILCVPNPDEMAIRAVQRLLHNTMDQIHVVEESSAQSQRYWIEDILRRWCDEMEIDLILTIGGTLPAAGPSTDEIVPEATLAVLERHLPGLPEAMRAHAQQQTTLALFDRGVAGIRGRTLILNLPAGAAPAQLFLDAVVGILEPIMQMLHDHPDAPTLAMVLDATDTPTHAADEVEPDATTSAPETPPRPSSKLDPREFSEFLERRRDQERGDRSGS